VAELERSPDVHAFWADFLAMAGGDASARFYESFHFGDSEMLADELAALVLVGAKRATASLLWSFEVDGKPLPKPGDLSCGLTGPSLPGGASDPRPEYGFEPQDSDSPEQGS